MRKKLYQYKILWLLMAMFMAYVLFGFLFLPKIINQQLFIQFSERLNMQAEMTAVKFNPLTFNTKIEGLTLTDSNQQTWYESELTGVNFDPLNLVWGEWNVSDLNLLHAKINIVVDENGLVLIPALPEFAQSTGSDEPINVSIDKLRLAQTHVKLKTGNINKDYSLNIKSIELDHDKFSLADKDTHFKIKITTENDEAIALKGFYNHAQQVLNSEIKLIDWQVTTLNQILPKELAISSEAGTIHADGSIDWLLSQTPLLKFSDIEIQALQSRWQNDVSVKQLQASIQQVVVDTDAQTVVIDRIESNQGDWEINWSLNSAAESDPQNNSDVVESESVENSDWQVSIDQINIVDWQVEVIDVEVAASLLFSVQSLEALKVNTINQSFTVQSQLRFAEDATLNIISEQVLSPLAVTANLDLKQMSLQQIAPWITDLTGLVFTEGTLTTQQQLKLNDEYYDLAGELTITNANINDQNAQSVASWDELHIAATTLLSQSQSIVLDQITVDNAQGTISLEPENNLNVQSLETNEASQKTEQNSDSSDWSIKIGAINNKEGN